MYWIILGSGSFYVKRHDFNCSFTCVSGALLFVSFCASWGPGKGTDILKRWATLSSASLNFVLGGACVRLLCCSRSCFFFLFKFQTVTLCTLWSPHSGLHSDCCQLEAPPPGDRWHEISLVVNCKEGRAFLSVDGKQAGQRFVFPPFINWIMPCPRCAHSLAPLFIKAETKLTCWSSWGSRRQGWKLGGHWWRYRQACSLERILFCTILEARTAVYKF